MNINIFFDVEMWSALSNIFISSMNGVIYLHLWITVFKLLFFFKKKLQHFKTLHVIPTIFARCNSKITNQGPNYQHSKYHDDSSFVQILESK